MTMKAQSTDPDGTARAECEKTVSGRYRGESFHHLSRSGIDLAIIGYGVASQLRERMALLDREGGARGYFGGSHIERC
jgi:hypothetical protein